MPWPRPRIVEAIRLDEQDVPEQVERRRKQDEENRSPQEKARLAKDQTATLLQTLTPREEQIVRMRFGIGGASAETLAAVGQRFSVTRERIRQIEAKALRKLRNPEELLKQREEENLVLL